MAIWYKIGFCAVNDGRNISLTLILLNIPGFFFLASAFVHEAIIGSYDGIIGTLTQNFYIPTGVISSEIAGLFQYNIAAFTGGTMVDRAFYADVVTLVLFLGSFIYGVITANKKKN